MSLSTFANLQAKIRVSFEMKPIMEKKKEVEKGRLVFPQECK